MQLNRETGSPLVETVCCGLGAWSNLHPYFRAVSFLSFFLFCYVYECFDCMFACEPHA